MQLNDKDQKRKLKVGSEQSSLELNVQITIGIGPICVGKTASLQY